MRASWATPHDSAQRATLPGWSGRRVAGRPTRKCSDDREPATGGRALVFERDEQQRSGRSEAARRAPPDAYPHGDPG